MFDLSNNISTLVIFITISIKIFIKKIFIIITKSKIYIFIVYSCVNIFRVFFKFTLTVNAVCTFEGNQDLVCVPFWTLRF